MVASADDTSEKDWVTVTFSVMSSRRLRFPSTTCQSSLRKRSRKAEYRVRGVPCPCPFPALRFRCSTFNVERLRLTLLSLCLGTGQQEISRELIERLEISSSKVPVAEKPWKSGSKASTRILNPHGRRLCDATCVNFRVGGDTGTSSLGPENDDRTCQHNFILECLTTARSRELSHSGGDAWQTLAATPVLTSGRIARRGCPV